MAILQLIAEKEKSLCFDFFEEKIREESRKLIESIYADEVNQFLEKIASIVDGKEKKIGCEKWLPQKPCRSNSLRKCGGKTAKSG